MKTSRLVVLLLIGGLARLTAQIEVVSGGNVGINTINPAHRLEVSGNTRLGAGVDYGTSTVLSVAPGTIDFDAPGISGGRLKIDGATGNVGIGTNAPTAKLHVVGSGFVQINPDDGALELASGNDSYSFIDFRGSANLGADFLGRIGYADGGGFDFSTAGSFAMKIAESGNVGIGTTAPNAPLHIYRGGQAEVRLQNESRQWAVLSNTAWGGSGLSLYDITADDSRLQISTTGNVGIGTITPGYKLEVAGTVRAASFISNTTTYADFVFKPGYKLTALAEVEQHINQHGTLPGVPSEAQVAKEGIDLATMQVKLLQKIEEITLHQIAQAKDIVALKAENARLQRQLSTLSLHP